MFHAKAMAVDGLRSMVGSFDVNRLERRNTMEATVMVEDRALADDIEAGFRQCLGRSRTIDHSEWAGRAGVQRLGEWMAYRMVRR